eukprot:1811829-Rhodomonas_salina.1
MVCTGFYSNGTGQSAMRLRVPDSQSSTEVCVGDSWEILKCAYGPRNTAVPRVQCRDLLHRFRRQIAPGQLPCPLQGSAAVRKITLPLSSVGFDETDICGAAEAARWVRERDARGRESTRGVADVCLCVSE